jgi:hypothetical protein
MTTTKTLLGSLAAAAVAALSIAAGTASAESPPTLTAGQGCSVQCVSKAAVTATPTAAKVELATTVLANLKVTVSAGRSPSSGR